ncbi:hypothetical protein WMY93_015183 [Mugilogobius chulae]|uniref:Exocyst complex component Sec3 PIP2-binding N-terminal domain-containing protein n=1 Tax=Mugilogobius chulae TaxID=88201 RepID=A0AAW0NXM4_9GOBI
MEHLAERSTTPLPGFRDDTIVSGSAASPLDTTTAPDERPGEGRHIGDVFSCRRKPVYSEETYTDTVTNKKPARLSITKVKQFQGSSSFVKRSQWSIDQLRQVNGIDSNKDCPEFDLMFDTTFDQWVASSSGEKCTFIQILHHTCQRYCSARKPDFLNCQAKLLGGRNWNCLPNTCPEVLVLICWCAHLSARPRQDKRLLPFLSFWTCAVTCVRRACSFESPSPRSAASPGPYRRIPIPRGPSRSPTGRPVLPRTASFSHGPPRSPTDRLVLPRAAPFSRGPPRSPTGRPVLPWAVPFSRALSYLVLTCGVLPCHSPISCRALPLLRTTHISLFVSEPSLVHMNELVL